MEIYTGQIISPFEIDKTVDFANLTVDNDKITIQFASYQHHHSVLDTLFGVFNGLGKVTLIHCENINSVSGGGGKVVTYSAELLFIGEHINDFKNHYFDHVNIVMTGLFDWIGSYSIINDLRDTNTVRIDPIPDLCIYDSEKISIVVFSTNQVKKEHVNNQITLNENSGIRILSKNCDLSIRDFLHLINEIKKLILILSNHDTKIETTNFYSKTSKRVVSLAWNGNKSIGTPPPMSPLLNYHEIKYDLPNIIGKWFEIEEMQVSIELILEKTLNQTLSWESQFLNSCFSIETYHRRFLNYKLFDLSEFKKIKRQILSTIDNHDIKQLIDNNLAHINEPNFRNRLTDLESDFVSLLPDTISPADYIRSIVKTRNYLVHRGERKNVFNEFDMLYSAFYLETIVKINVFRTLGIEEAVIQKLLPNLKDQIFTMYEVNKELQFD